MGNIFGKVFRVITFGESHGPAVGAVIDGCPAGLSIKREEIQKELDRRRPGFGGNLTSRRREKDRVKILSGIYKGKTLGTPIALAVFNKDARPEDYGKIKDIYRPGHADFVYEAKYGFHDWRGGGRASARETVGRVAAGAVAKKLLETAGIKINGYVIQVGKARVGTIDEKFAANNPLRCPDKRAYKNFLREIEVARREGDSIGGTVELAARNVPPGFGEPVFDKLSADLAKAMMSIPGVKGVEIGDGFAVVSRRGSENNDEWVVKSGGRIGTKTNRAGGIIGGISTGEPVIVRCALKPTSSIGREQRSIDRRGKTRILKITGRHDLCICFRAVAVIEAMAAIVLADHYLLNKLSRV